MRKTEVRIRGVGGVTQLKTTLSSKLINLNHVLIEKRPEWEKKQAKVMANISK